MSIYTPVNEVNYMTLDEIDAEIKELRSIPQGQMTVSLAQKLRCLMQARFVITGYWGYP